MQPVRTAVLCLALLPFAVAQAQTTTTSPVVPPASTMLAQGIGSGSGSVVVFGPGGGYRGLPYSLSESTTTVQTLADGSHITHVRRENIMRDAEGRTRTEVFIQMRPESTSELEHVQIFDPVARTNTFLSPMMKTATITHLPVPRTLTPDERAAARARAIAARQSQPEQNQPRPQMTVESLGSKTIAGIYAEGRRTTRIIPPGLEGNDRELRSVTETWNSPDLHIELERTTDDPRAGHSTMTVTSLERTSPDPVLFQVPPNYKVDDRQATDGQ